MSVQKRHFLIVAGTSRGARIFVKNALRQGHDVTAICRAPNDEAALDRMRSVLDETALSEGGPPKADREGTLRASCKSVTEKVTYQELLNADPTIDALCCFVGVTSNKEMMNAKLKLYTRTVAAIVGGMRESRWTETFYHGSVGSEGVPGQSVVGWPQNYNIVFRFYTSILVPALYPVYKDVTESEDILGRAGPEGLEFVIFRPAALTDGPAKRHVGFSFDRTWMDEGDLPLRKADVTISREDVAEEMLRIATLPKVERAQWHGHGVYMVDMHPGYRGPMVQWPRSERRVT